MTQPVLTGTVESVSMVTLGDALTAAALTGATTVTVDDTTDFDSEAGGTVSINGTLYTYTAVDDDTGVVTLSSGLTADAAIDDRVDVWDTAAGAAAVEWRALVSTPEEIDSGDSIDALVGFALVPLLPEGIRDPDTGETVTLEQRNGEWTVADVLGVAPYSRGGLVIPAGAGTGQRVEIDRGGVWGYDSAGVLRYAMRNDVSPLLISDLDLITSGQHGITFGSGGADHAAAITQDNGGGQYHLYIDAAYNGTNHALDAPSIKLAANDGITDGTIQISTPGDLLLTFQGSGGLKVGHGVAGKYHYEEVSLSNQSLTSGSGPAVTNLTAVQTLSDYGSGFNLTTGVWTCPADGVYSFTFYVVLSSSFVAGSRFFVGIRYTASGAYLARCDSNPSSGGAGVGETVSCRRWIDQGTTIDFRALQNTGSTQTINGAASYISVQREL